MAPRKTSGQVYVCKSSISVEVDGVPYGFTTGQTRVRDGHPAVKLLKKSGTFDQFFEPVDDHVTYDVEQATAAPGEVRE